MPIKPAVARESAVLSGRFDVANGTLEALKWGALILMVLDHINKYFFDEQLPGVFPIGRIVMPIFGFVLAFNLARPNALARGVHVRMMYRLTLTGLAATPIVIVLNAPLVGIHPLLPLNILFTLLLVVLLTYLIERGGIGNHMAALALFVIAGALVEYLWFGVLCCLTAWGFCRQASADRLVWWCLGTLGLTLVNGNAWAMMAIPVVLAASHVTIRCPRWPFAFYSLYPAHLLVLSVIRWEWCG